MGPGLKQAWKLLFVAAGLWSLVAGARVALAPGMAQQVTASGQVGVNGEVETQNEVTTEQVSWYEMQGAWGIVILLIFAGLYGGAAALAQARARDGKTGRHPAAERPNRQFRR
jgi:hypothetical protein